MQYKLNLTTYNQLFEPPIGGVSDCVQSSRNTKEEKFNKKNEPFSSEFPLNLFLPFFLTKRYEKA